MFRRTASTILAPIIVENDNQSSLLLFLFPTLCLGYKRRLGTRHSQLSIFFMFDRSLSLGVTSFWHVWLQWRTLMRPSMLYYSWRTGTRVFEFCGDVLEIANIGTQRSLFWEALPGRKQSYHVLENSTILPVNSRNFSSLTLIIPLTLNIHGFTFSILEVFFRSLLSLQWNDLAHNTASIHRGSRAILSDTVGSYSHEFCELSFDVHD